MEIISPFPFDPSLTLDLNSDRDFATPISGASPASDSFSASSSPDGPFTPASGRSTPQERHTYDSSCPQSVCFDMNPLPNYATGSLSPEYKPEMTRADYLGTYVPDGLPVRQSVESVPSSLEYGDYVEMSMPQTYSTSAPVDPPAYDMYPMAGRYRARLMNSSVAANTVCMSEMCNNEPYDFNNAMINRPPLLSMAAFPARDHLRSSDTETVGSPTVLSPLDAIPSPELQHRMSMVNIGDRTDNSRHGVSARRGNSLEQMLLNAPKCNGKEHIGVVEIKNIKSSENTCKFAGCKKSFNRKEHLKRHERATHGHVEFKCPFCQEKKDKPFNRWDNFKHHVRMHSLRRNQGRVEFHPDAVAYFEQMERNTRPRTRRGGVSASRRAGPRRSKRGPPFVGRHNTM